MLLLLLSAANIILPSLAITATKESNTAVDAVRVAPTRTKVHNIDSTTGSTDYGKLPVQVLDLGKSSSGQTMSSLTTKDIESNTEHLSSTRKLQVCWVQIKRL
jgi:hypothetical protein